MSQLNELIEMRPILGFKDDRIQWIYLHLVSLVLLTAHSVSHSTTDIFLISVTILSSVQQQLAFKFMGPKILLLCVTYYSMLHSFHAATPNSCDCASSDQQLKQCVAKFEAYQNDALSALKPIFSEKQLCEPCRDQNLRKELRNVKTEAKTLSQAL